MLTETVHGGRVFISLPRILSNASALPHREHIQTGVLFSLTKSFLFFMLLYLFILRIRIEFIHQVCTYDGW